MNRLLARILSLWLTLAYAFSVAAQVAEEPVIAEAPAESSEYQRAIHGALEEYRLQHFEEARALFEKAHGIDPNARTLRGLGMVEFERRHYVRAQELLEASLASTKKPLTPDQRSAVQELLVRTNQFVSHFVVAANTPSDLEVEVDGRPVVLDGERSFAVEAGEHELRFRAKGMQARELHVDAVGGERRTLALELVAEARGLPVPNRAPANPTRSPVGIALACAGAAVIAGGLVLGGFALKNATDVTVREERARGLAIGADVSIGVGVATVVAGAILLLTKRRARSREHALSLRGGAAPSLQVSF
jgi:hypothetical protein